MSQNAIKLGMLDTDALIAPKMMMLEGISILDQVTFAILTSVVLLGKFADFLMQSPISISTETKDGPTISVQSQSFVRMAVDGARRYLLSVFHRGFFNPVRLWRVFLISAFLVQGSFIFSSLIVPEVWSVEVSAGKVAFPFVQVSAAVLLLIFTNFVFDLIAISVILYFLEHERGIETKHETFSIIRLSVLFIVMIATFYFIVVSTMNLSFSLMLHLQGIAAGYETLHQSYADVFEMHKSVLVNETAWRFLDPINEGRHIGLNGVNLFIFCLTPLLAPMLIFVVILGGALLDIADIVSEGRVGGMFGALAKNRKPFFLKLASIFALTGAAASSLIPLL